MGHGDIDENMSLGDVKAPNVFKRAKEEIDAVIDAIHQHKREEAGKSDSKSEKPENEMKKQNFIEKAKDEIDSLFHNKEKPRPHRHHKETHGRSDDIDENTSVDEVKGPNVFERAKEEMEAVVDAIRHKKKEREDSISPQKGRFGFGCSLGKGLQKVCHPWGDGKKD